MNLGPDGFAHDSYAAPTDRAVQLKHGPIRPWQLDKVLRPVSETITPALDHPQTAQELNDHYQANQSIERHGLGFREIGFGCSRRATPELKYISRE
jgi:hypothetical protein